MQTRHLNDRGIVGGVLLILLGVIFFAATMGVGEINWDNIWPGFVMAVGVALLAQLFFAKPTDRPGLVMWGTSLVLLGIFFFATTLGYTDWEEQANLWPVYLLIFGVGNLAAYFTSRMEKIGYLIWSLVLLALGVFFGALVLTGVMHDGKIAWFDWEMFREWTFMREWWPIWPIAVGVFLLALGLTRRSEGARGALVFSGTIPLLIGVFFLFFSFGLVSWEAQGDLWPTYTLIVGIAFLVWYLMTRLKVPAFLWVGAGLCLLALTFYVEQFANFDVWGTLWPLVLVIIGLAVLLPTLRRKPQ